ncbi:hypothetical protein J3E68DRAFT_211158 [Trichoderma sp. SZMC 28012]
MDWVPKMRTSYNGKAWTEGSRTWILAMGDFHPYTVLDEIYFLLNMLGNVHTHTEEGREKEGKGGQTNTAGNFGCTATIFGQKFTGGEDVYYSFFLLLLLYCVGCGWMDGCVSGMHVVLKSENLSIYVILYIECFFLYFFFSFLLILIDGRCWMGVIVYE